MDAILYVDRTGIPWRYLPHDFAPWETVYGYFAAWQKEGVFDRLNGLLRRMAREAEGRDAEPSACVLDAQSIKTSANVPAAGQGIDAGKKIAGRKRHIGVDTLGLLLAVWVTAASVSDNTGGIHLLTQISATAPRVTKAWADTGYRTKAIDHGARLGIDVEVVRRDPGVKGFKVIPRRWVVERTFGWLMHLRRLARDYETHPHRSEAIIHVAMIDLISRRLTSESTPNWRDT
jgi:transposase